MFVESNLNLILKFIRTIPLLIVCISNPIFAQQVKFIKGYVYDENSKEALIGATIYQKEGNIGTNTNNSGFFVLDISKSISSEINISYVGYSPKQFNIASLTKDSMLVAYLSPRNELEEVVVNNEDATTNTFQNPASIISLNSEVIKKTPQLFGEVDVLKTLQLMPGIKGGSEGQSGIYVRGGSPDQNLILVDGVPVYNVSHLFGFFSVFNADAIQNVNVYKGGFPARYGGRLSSVIDLNFKDGNKQKIHGEGSIGLISAKFMLEGPIVKNKTSFMVAARRTYLDAFASPIIGLASEGRFNAGYYFYDFNLKVNHRINDRNHLTLSTYWGDDNFYVRSRSNGFTSNSVTKANLTWGNRIATLKWQHILNDNIYINTSLSYSRYYFNVGVINQAESNNILKPGKELTRLVYKSGIDDFIFNHEYEHTINDKHVFRYGFRSIFHVFNTGILQNKSEIESDKIDTTIGKASYATENSLFFEHEWQPNSRLKFNNGIHWNSFLINGKFYQMPQPRLSARYFITDRTNIRASFSTMMQNIHLLSTNNIGLPTEIWVPATQKIKPQTSWQISSGVSQYLFQKKYEISVEGYYKRMTNTVDYLEGASFLAPGQDWQNVVDQGKAWSYGAEFLAQKKQGKTTGWIGYTLSWAYRQYPNINFGNIFPYRYDRRHDISVVIQHSFNKKWDIGATWVYNTGNSVSIQQSNFTSFENNTYNGNLAYFESRNSFKMPSYHRLDLSINHRKQKKRGVRTWNLSVYNVYARQNAYFLFQGNNEKGEPKIFSMALFSIIPSLSYSFKF